MLRADQSNWDVRSPIRDRSDVVTGADVLRTLATWVFIAAGSGLLTWLIASKLASRFATTNEPALLIVFEVYLSLPVAMMINLGGWPGLRDRLGLRFTSWKDIGLALGVWLIAVAASALALVILTPLLGSPAQVLHPLLSKATDVSRLRSATPLDLTLIGVRVVLLAGLGEELFYRGLLFSWLRTRLSTSLAIVITAIIFGLEHFYPAVILLAMLFGLAAGWIRARTGSTFNTLIMHSLTDCLLLVLAILLVGP